MAKASGLSMTAFKRDDSCGCLQCLVNCVTNLDWSTPRNTQDITGLCKSSTERLLLLGDYSSTPTLIFNSCANKSHAVHNSVASADVTRTETIQIECPSNCTTLTNEVLITDYSLTRAATGELTISAPASLQSGCDPSWS